MGFGFGLGLGLGFGLGLERVRVARLGERGEDADREAEHRE